MKAVLQVPQRITFGKKNVLFNVHPKSSYKIKNDRATECKKGNIDEVQTDFARSNVEVFA